MTRFRRSAVPALMVVALVACSSASSATLTTEAPTSAASTSSSSTTTTVLAPTTTSCLEHTADDRDGVRFECVDGQYVESIVSNPSVFVSTTTSTTLPPTTTVPPDVITGEDLTAALDGPAAAWILSTSDDAAAALSAGAQSLIDSGRPFPPKVGFVSTEEMVRKLAAGPDLPTLELMRPVLPSLPALVDDGVYTVGEGIEPGKYRTVYGAHNCYWETLDEAGEINRNNFVNAAPQVIATIRKTDFAFNSEGCGPWVKIG